MTTIAFCWGKLCAFIAAVYHIIKAFVVQVFSVFNDSSTPGAPWSLRRWGAVFFGWMFYRALEGILAALVLPTPPPLWEVIAILVAPLIGVIFLLFFTTWGDIKSLISAGRGRDMTGGA